MGAVFGFFRQRSSIVTLYEELDWEALEQEYEQLCCENHQVNLSVGDSSWADELAKLWVEFLRNIYLNKGIPELGVDENIVIAQALRLSEPIERILQDIDWETKDKTPLEILKDNVWDFSVAKNHNDCLAINNLLIREDGSLRPWSDFKREAERVVGRSSRYLKTEYNTVVAGAMMSRKWQEIQRDKHIFPYVMFDVVNDRHTSDICRPLHNVIVKVDDPMLMYYFPPNHFNCRTDVRRLRYGKPTEKYNLPEIPDAFKNNVGMTGKIFSDANRYIMATPEDVLKHREMLQEMEVLKQPREQQFITLLETENGGKVLEHVLLKKGDDYQSILTAAQEFAKQGKIVEIMPELNRKELRHLRNVVYINYDLFKNPDLRVDGVYHDVKEVEQLYNFIRNANRAVKQGSIPILQFDKTDDISLIKKQVDAVFEDKHYIFDVVYVLHKGVLYKYNKG